MSTHLPFLPPLLLFVQVGSQVVLAATAAARMTHGKKRFSDHFACSLRFPHAPSSTLAQRTPFPPRPLPNPSLFPRARASSACPKQCPPRARTTFQRGAQSRPSDLPRPFRERTILAAAHQTPLRDVQNSLVIFLVFTPFYLCDASAVSPSLVSFHIPLPLLLCLLFLP